MEPTGDLKGDGLEELKKRLYRKGEKIEDTKERVELKREWIDPPPLYWQQEKMSPQKKSSLKIFVWLSVLLVIIFGGVAAYFLFSDKIIISSQKINLDVKGPNYIDAGTPFNFSVSVENKNEVNMETVDLVLVFPNGTIDKNGDLLTRTRISLGKIERGAYINKDFNVVLFGGENEEKKISATLEYRFEQSNAIFSKNFDYVVKIKRSALGIFIAMPGEINANQEIELNVDVVSNSQIELKDIYLSLSYPSGFTFINSSPEPNTEKKVWFIGSLKPLEKKTIVIKGLIDGQDREEKIFRAVAGVRDEENNILSYGNSLSSATIKRNQLGLIMFINGSDMRKNILKSGDMVRATLRWQNNASFPIRNAILEVNLDGAIDENSVSASRGIYNQNERKIIWNSSTFNELSYLGVGQVGEVQFSFTLKDNLPISSDRDKNFSVNITAKAQGDITTEEAQNIAIRNEIKKEISIISGLNTEVYISYRSGKFKNSGPLPPKVGEETTYTINILLSGNSNDLKNVNVKIPLLPYVRWLNSVFPSGENLSFDSKTGILLWSVDNLPVGTGIISSKKEISFQIGFTPSASQERRSPELTGKVEVSAFDTFVEDYISYSINPLTTVLNGDADFQSKEGVVVK